MSVKSIRHHRSFVVIVVLMAFASTATWAQRNESPETMLQRAIQKELVDGDLKAAVDLYKRVIDTRGARDAVKAEAWLNLGRSYERMADANARSAYERVIRDYRGQLAFVSEAQARLKALELPSSRTRLFADLTYMPNAGTVTWLPNRPPGGAVSPDGRFVFVSDPVGPVFDVVTHESAYLRTQRSSATASVLPHAAFSSDSRQIAFATGGVSRSAVVSTAEMRIAPLPPAIRESDLKAGRTAFRQEGVVGIAPFAWNDDGEHVLAMLSHEDGNNEIASIDVTNGSHRVIKSLGRRSPSRLAMSPDGRYVAYDSSVDSADADRDISLLSVANGAETPLADDPARDEGPLWTPDGSAVVFFSERGGKAGIWMREVVAGAPSGPARLIRQYETRVWPVGFSRDGTFYYSSEKDRAGGGLSIDPRFLPNYERLRVFVGDMDPSGNRVRGQAASVTNSMVAVPSAPRWLPDGRTLALNLIRLGDGGMVIRTLSSGTDRIYSGFLTYGTTWFHSSKAMLVGRSASRIAGKSMPAAIGRLDLDSGIESEFMTSPSPSPLVGPMALTTDDKTLYVATKGPGSGNVMVIDVDSRREVRRFSMPMQVGGRAPNPGSLSLSPDGRTLAIWMDGGLFRVGVDGSGWKELYPAEHFDWDTRPVWTKDGQGILIAVSDKERHWRLLRVPAEGGKPAFTGLADTLPKDRMMDFDLTPDGTRLVFVGVAPTISSDRR